MKFIETFIKEGQYISEESVKTQIVLHHTISSSVESTIGWWNQTKERVATHFIIDKSGNVHLTFPEKYWAYHIGKGSTSQHNKSSFGIEIVNEGPLVKRNDEYFWFDGKAKYSDLPYEWNWRNYNYWASYTQKQFGATLLLLKYLCDTYNINHEVITTMEYDKSYFDFNGIVSHHNLRPDKTDVSPAFDLDMANRILNSAFNPLLFDPSLLKEKPLETIRRKRELG